MEPNRFDSLTRRLGARPDRRAALRALAGAVLAVAPASVRPADTEAGKRKKTNKKRACSGERCGKTCCPKGKFCCDPKRGRCCGAADECCNPGNGTGICCAQPGRCGKPVGASRGKAVCCPPDRQWFTAVGLVRCCPKGTKSMGAGITTNGGPCCPAESYCGGACCSEGLVCAGGSCCAPENVCGDTCCLASSCRECVNGTCRSKCTQKGDYCYQGECRNCGPSGCGG